MGSNDFQGAIYCCFLVISIIVYVVQLSADKGAEPSGGVVGNGTAHACAHFVTVNNRTTKLECGGACVKECGICDPQYDGCIGTKYCPVKCPTGKPCVYEPGTVDSDCEGICSEKNECIDLPPLKVSDNELQMHTMVTLMYGGILLANLVLLFRNPNGPRTVRELFRMQPPPRINNDLNEAEVPLQKWFMLISLLLTIMSGSFLIAASANREHSLYASRMITMCIAVPMLSVLILFLLLIFKNSITGHLTLLFGGMWFMILFIDLSNSVVGNGQALLRATGRLHHGMPGDLKCGHTEFEAYVSWNLVFGLFTYIFTNAASHYKIHGLENYAKFSITVACHSLVMWLVAASIYTACTDIGHKMYVPFGVTTCVVFSAFVLPCLYYITQQSTPAPDLSDLAVATETDKPSNKTAAGPMFAHEGASTSFTQMLGDDRLLYNVAKPRMLLLGWFVGEFLVVCWTMYIVKNQKHNA